jgi:SAM-dependent methyltransferase
MTNPDYTNLWTQDFDENQVQKYDHKFKSRWEKHIKHVDQVAFIRRHLGDWMYWCDAPIGSGRLMDELKTQRVVGFDISDGFLAYNRKKGIHCEKGDLFEFGKIFQNEFDLITSLHSIFAFQEYKLILEGFVEGLKPGGILIVDITNKLHAQAARDIKKRIFEDSSNYPDGMTRSEIVEFFDSIECDVVEISSSDYWDNYYFFDWRYLKGNALAKRFKQSIWEALNFLYFRLSLAKLFRKVATGRPESDYTTYLVAVQKRTTPKPIE